MMPASNLVCASSMVNSGSRAVGVFHAKQGACYRCLHPQPPHNTIPNCAESGVIGAVAGTSVRCRRWKLQADRWMETLTSRLLHYDARNGLNRVLQIPKRAGCVCACKPEEIVLTDEHAMCLRHKKFHGRGAQIPNLIYVDVRETWEWITVMSKAPASSFIRFGAKRRMSCYSEARTGLCDLLRTWRAKPAFHPIADDMGLA